MNQARTRRAFRSLSPILAALLLAGAAAGADASPRAPVTGRAATPATGRAATLATSRAATPASTTAATPAGSTPSVYGWAVIRSPKGLPYSVPARDGDSSEHAGVFLRHYNTGAFGVTFNGVGAVIAGCDGTNGCFGATQVSAMGLAQATCISNETQVDGPDLEAFVLCQDSHGHAVDSRFTVSFVAHRDPRGALGYLLARQVGPTTYGAIAGSTYNSAGGTSKIHRIAAGRYKVVLPNLPVALAGNLQVTGGAVQSGYTKFAGCRVTGRSTAGSHSSVIVRCENASGALVDSSVNVTYTNGVGLQGDDESGSLPYLSFFANKPTAASYHPQAAFRSSTGSGAPTITRTAVGRYTALLPDMPLGGAAIVTAYGSAESHCQIGAIRTSGAEQAVKVTCFGLHGVHRDSLFYLSFEH